MIVPFWPIQGPYEGPCIGGTGWNAVTQVKSQKPMFI